MRLVPRAMLIGTGLVAATAAAALSHDLTIQSFDPIPGDPTLAYGTYQHPAGGRSLTLAGGIGSAAWRAPGDPQGVFWTLSDRGANFTCEDAESVLGIHRATACPAAGSVPAGVGRLYPMPGYTPSIYQVQLQGDGTFRVLQTIPLRTARGTPVTGLPNPFTTATTEIPRDGDGQPLAQDASAIDGEALVRLPFFGGRFYIAEENGPSLVEAAADGRILKRFVPAGTEREYSNPPPGIAPAGYVVEGTLPGLLAKRRLNRGFESLAPSRDMRFLYVMLQSPLDHPSTAVRDSRNLRLFKLRLIPHPAGSSLELVGEYVYRFEPVAFFQAQGAADAGRQRDLRVSEMLHLGDERFLVLERTDLVTALFEIDLAGATNILGSAWDHPATTPSLEAVPDPAAVGVTAVSKQLRLVASSREGASPRFPEKLEGLAFDRDGRLMIINDDDFGITGQRLQVNLVGGLGLELR